MNKELTAYIVAAILMLYIFAPVAIIAFLLNPIIGGWAIIPTFSWVAIGPLSLLFICEYIEKRNLRLNGVR